MTPLDAIARLERDARRVAEIAKVAARYGLADWLKGVRYSKLQDWLRDEEGQSIAGLSVEERFRLALTDLGTTFIKLGQMLSTRPELVGQALATELARLQASTPADPPATARATFANELGRPPEEAFAEFDPTAFASASIAQVHRARLRSGEPVVVKIQKQGIESRILADLSILAGMADLAEKHSHDLKAVRPVALVRQLRRSLLQELDFNHERRSIEEFAHSFAHDETVHFPRVHRELCARRVLTMERLDGIPGSDPAGLRASGADLDAFARHGANLFLEMIFRDSFYHADPHPGNLMLLEGGVVGVIDCGMVGRLDESLRDEIEGMLAAVAARNSEDLAEAVSRLGEVPATASRDQLRVDLAEFVGDYARRSIDELDLSAALNSLVEIVRRHHIVLPPQASMLLRTLVLLEGTSRLLVPAFSLAELIQPFIRRSLHRHLSPQRLVVRLQRAYRDWDRLFRVLPRELNDALSRVRTGKFNVHLDHRHLDPVVNRLVVGILTASLFLGSSLLWSTKAPPLLFGVSVFGAAGYLLSIYLGWRVLRAVRKSGNVQSKDE